MKFRFVENVNFTNIFRTTLGVVGALMIILPTEFMKASWLWMLLLLCGLVFLALGGFASRAYFLGIKPFDNSYKNARKTYGGDNEGDFGANDGGVDDRSRKL